MPQASEQKPAAGGAAVAEPQPAGVSRRLGAMLYDFMLLVALWTLTLMLLVTITGDVVVGAPVQTLLFLETFLFFAYFWIRGGQTLGMRAWRLVLHSNTGRLTPNQVTMRFIGALMSFATLGLGYGWMYIDRDRRTWPDIFSDSHILHDPSIGRSES